MWGSTSSLSQNLPCTAVRVRVFSRSLAHICTSAIEVPAVDNSSLTGGLKLIRLAAAIATIIFGIVPIRFEAAMLLGGTNARAILDYMITLL